MRRGGWRVIVVAALAAAAVSCGGGDDDVPAIDSGGSTIDVMAGGPDAAPDAEPSSVTIIDCGGLVPDETITTAGFAFAPNMVTINAGQVIQFMPSASVHNMTAGQPGAPTGEFGTPTGETVCLRFTEAGSFPFYCSVHPAMTGTITVQ